MNFTRLFMRSSECSAYQLEEGQDEKLRQAINDGTKLVTVKMKNGPLLTLVVSEIEGWFTSSPESREKDIIYSKTVDDEIDEYKRRYGLMDTADEPWKR